MVPTILMIADLAFTIAYNCGLDMLGTMYLQADLMVNGNCSEDQLIELGNSLMAEWDACTIILMD